MKKFYSRVVLLCVTVLPTVKLKAFIGLVLLRHTLSKRMTLPEPLNRASIDDDRFLENKNLVVSVSAIQAAGGSIMERLKVAAFLSFDATSGSIPSQPLS